MRNSSKIVVLTLKIYQYSLSPFFQILINGLPTQKESGSSKKDPSTSSNFPTSSSSPELNKSISKRKSSSISINQNDPAYQQENEKLIFWQNSIAAFFGGVFEGTLIHFGYSTELTDLKVDKENITYAYSIERMERPYELPSQFL